VLNIPVAAPILAEALSSATAIVVEAAFFFWRKSIKVTHAKANNGIHILIIDKIAPHCGPYFLVSPLPPYKITLSPPFSRP
jgi:hypothetical protein